ncbi:helix-turn-helix domain-containing protein [Streptomyces sp. NPDC021093]|uniref:helix-turn-helix domain-containing protein n=1 Tax=Streptomyces sp. NPDC021093 TaxID=3365112 RepID=UPI0037A6F31A
MIRSPRAWALEQNDCRTVFACGAEATMFAESRPFRVTSHRLPAWKAVLPIGGHAELRLPGGPLVVAPGLIVPPQLAHSCAVSSPYVALFVDPWLLPSHPEPLRLDAGEVRRLLAALGATDSHGPRTDVDLAAGYTELRTLTGSPAPLDPRVAHAVHLCTLRDPDLPFAPLAPVALTTPIDPVSSLSSVSSIAHEVGLSAPRLRALVRQDVGVALSRLRRWGRLRTAIAALPDSTAALAAATAGFADQAHLTRTARDFIGRTPASLRTAGTPSGR